MKLLDNFYRIHSLELSADGKLVAEVELEERHQIYDGHFPGHPVVPGVCTLTVIKECLSVALKRNIAFTSVRECKYTSSLIPEKGLRIRLDFLLSDDFTSLKGSVIRLNDMQPVLKLKAGLG